MKILLPIDGSPSSLEAVRWAVRLIGEGLRASCVLANVQEPATLYEMMVVHDAQALQQVSGAAGAHLLAAAQALLDEAGIPHASEVASGDPAHALLDLIERAGCDAVILGARSGGTLGAALAGSVSQALLRHSNVPVMVVKPREAPAVDEGPGLPD